MSRVLTRSRSAPSGAVRLRARPSISEASGISVPAQRGTRPRPRCYSEWQASFAAAPPPSGSDRSVDGEVLWWRTHPRVEIPRPGADVTLGSPKRLRSRTTHGSAADASVARPPSGGRVAWQRREQPGVGNSAERATASQEGLPPPRAVPRDGKRTRLPLHRPRIVVSFVGCSAGTEELVGPIPGVGCRYLRVPAVHYRTGSLGCRG